MLFCCYLTFIWVQKFVENLETVRMFIKRKLQRCNGRHSLIKNKKFYECLFDVYMSVSRNLLTKIRSFNVCWVCLCECSIQMLSLLNADILSKKDTKFFTEKSLRIAFYRNRCNFLNVRNWISLCPSSGDIVENWIYRRMFAKRRKNACVMELRKTFFGRL